jgi:hypothetical protein
LTRRLGLAAATVACLLAVCAAWVGAAVPKSSNVVTVRLRPDQRQPARSAGHICTTDEAHGTICARFVAGERPVDSLVIAIAGRGLRPNIAR